MMMKDTLNRDRSNASSSRDVPLYIADSVIAGTVPVIYDSGFINTDRYEHVSRAAQYTDSSERRNVSHRGKRTYGKDWENKNKNVRRPLILDLFNFSIMNVRVQEITYVPTVINGHRSFVYLRQTRQQTRNALQHKVLGRSIDVCFGSGIHDADAGETPRHRNHGGFPRKMIRSAGPHVSCAVTRRDPGEYEAEIRSGRAIGANGRIVDVDADPIRQKWCGVGQERVGECRR